MQFPLIILISVLATGCVAGNSQKSYAGYKLFRGLATTYKQLLALVGLQNSDYGFDFWSEPAQSGFTDIMSPPEKIAQLEQFFENHGIAYSVMVDDVGRVITEERTSMSQPRNDVMMDWSEYQSLATIEAWFTNLTVQYPDLVSVLDIGKSSEGRDLKVVKISTGGNPDKPAIFIDATIHAREWISTATATYMINELTTNSDNYSDILDGFDWYFLAVINPDGYFYSWQTDRMWRKTRSVNAGNTCRGKDANRNYDFKWNSCPGCSSGSACSDTFRGAVAFSEPEAAAMRDFILNSNNLTTDVNWEVYISIHSYGQYFMSPWGYTNVLPEDYLELKLVADYVAGNISALYGTRYTTGSSNIVIYPTDGTSQDWAYGAGGFKYVYTAELRDTGVQGFLLNKAQIIPTGQETWAGFQAIPRHILSKF